MSNNCGVCRISCVRERKKRATLLTASDSSKLWPSVENWADLGVQASIQLDGRVICDRCRMRLTQFHRNPRFCGRLVLLYCTFVFIFDER